MFKTRRIAIGASILAIGFLGTAGGFLVGTLPGTSRLTVHAAVHTTESKPYSTWSEYGGTRDSSQYSSLTQIDKSNVAQLEQVWFYQAGNNGFRFGSNPIVVGNVMYVIGKNNAVVALEATTGKELWVHDTGRSFGMNHRGLSYWQSKDGSERRILYSAGNQLHALDARTGNLIESFGDKGSVDLRVGLGRDPVTIRAIGSGSPGRVFEDLLIVGSATGEDYNSSPGDLRAYNVRTGELVWSFRTIPHPGEKGYETWPPEAWKYAGGVNTWSEITIDEKRGIAYFPLGAPTYDFYAADRLGDNLFSDCLLALDARTGKYLWHFQTTHHDLWDYDLATAPKLLTIRHDGKLVDVVAQASKNGFVFVLNRETGEPIWPIVERPVPKSDMPGEQASPTQPFPTAPPPFERQSFTPEDVNPYIADPAEREKIREEVSKSRNQGLYTPGFTTDTMEIPGNNGGSNWGSGAVDPPAGTLYILSKTAPSMLKLEAKQKALRLPGSPAVQGRILYIQNCQMCHRADLTSQPPAIPSLVNVVSRVGPDRIKLALRGGAAPMPAFNDFTPADVDNVIAYLTDPESAHISAELLAFLNTPPIPVPAVNGAPIQRYWTGYGYMNSSEGLPAIKPPWSTLTAYDLNQGTIKWQIPYGTVPQLAAKGITDTGGFWPRGGVAVTAGGLIFAPSKSDFTFRAYDKDTGKVLWEKHLPAGPEGIPTVYEVDGREYVAVSADPVPEASGTEGRKLPPPDPSVQGYYVFALPKNATVHPKP
jgi:quinoprotein glucose dehydrogenase